MCWCEWDISTTRFISRNLCESQNSSGCSAKGNLSDPSAESRVAVTQSHDDYISGAQMRRAGLSVLTSPTKATTAEKKPMTTTM